MTIFNICADLREAHSSFCPEQMADSPCFPTSDIRTLRMRLIAEEMEEIETAIHTNDLVEFADGVADTLYVTVGTALACGIDLGQRWKDAGGSDDPFEDMLERVRDSGHMPMAMGLPLNRGRVEEVFFTQAYVKAALATAALLEVMEAGDDIESVVDPILRLTAALCELSVRSGIDLRGVWAEVHRSNMAKVGGGRRADGKFLKPPGWTPPDVRGALEAQGVLV